MQSTSLENYITLNINGKDSVMSLDEYSRWLCLLEGIEFVSKRVDQLKKRSNTPAVDEIDWIKPLAFQKYIEERHESMKSDLFELEKRQANEQMLT